MCNTTILTSSSKKRKLKNKANNFESILPYSKDDLVSNTENELIEMSNDDKSTDNDTPTRYSKRDIFH